MRYNSTDQYDIKVRDVIYKETDNKELQASVYEPQGEGPFPLLIDIHGGGWSNFNRLRDEPIDRELAAHGVVVAALDFRLNGQAPHPAAMRDINHGIRWFKAHAAEFNTIPEHVGAIGYSSGGHQVLLSGLRPTHPEYQSESDSVASGQSAELSYVISCGGITDLIVSSLAGTWQGRDDPLGIARYYGGLDGLMDNSPQHILDKGEDVYLPHLLILQAGADEFMGGQVKDAVRFAESYTSQGGFVELSMIPQASHVFLNPGLALPSEAMARGFLAIKGFISRELQYDSAPYRMTAA
jgi:acetyl esterase